MSAGMSVDFSVSGGNAECFGADDAVITAKERDALLPRRVRCARHCAVSGQRARASEQAREDTSPTKIDVTCKSLS